MPRLAVFVVVASLVAGACSESGSDDDRITRIDGPAVVDEDE